MLELIVAHYFVILWGLSISIVALLTVIVILRKDILSKIIKFDYENIKELFIPRKEFFEGRENLSIVLTGIQTKQEEILNKIVEHDGKIIGKLNNLPLDENDDVSINVDELAAEFATRVKAKMKSNRKVDKY